MKNLKLFSEAKIWTFENRVFLTDPPNAKRMNAVFPLCWENLYLAKNMLDVKPNYKVLDLCTGCGILAVTAAERTCDVTAVDINERAIEFARLNAELNGVEKNINFLTGNLFEPVEKQKFDLVIINPPFEPVPHKLSYFLHSDGGPSGLNIVSKFFGEINDYLKPKGQFQMISYFPLNGHNILKKIKKQFCKISIKKLGKVNGQYRDRMQKKLFEFNPQSDLADIVVPDMGCLLIAGTKMDIISSTKIRIAV